DRDEPHGPTLRSFADCLSIDRIVLVPLYEWLHIGRRDQLHLVTQLREFASPVVCTSAGLQRHQASWLPGEELQQLHAADLPAEQRSTARICAVCMENVLRDIKADCGNFRHGRLLKWCAHTSTLAHRCRRGASTPSPYCRP